MDSLEVKGTKLEWHGHDTFSVTAAGTTVVTDPFELPAAGLEAGAVLVTHGHYDHCDAGKVRQVAGKETTIICPPSCKPKLEGIGKEIVVLTEGMEKVVSSGSSQVRVKAVPAYNVGTKFHPRGEGVGFVFSVGEAKVYIAGDTDRIPEMKALAGEKIDVALLPVGGTYTMTAEEAAGAVKDIQPSIAVPMHFGSIVGSEKDAEKFAALAGNAAKVVVLRKKK